MARNSRERAYRPKKPFITVEGIKSPAYEPLSPHAVWCLNEFYKKFNGYNRYNLSLTKGDVRHKMSAPTLTKAIWELIAFGFIDRVKWGGGMYGICSIYGLSQRWKTIGKSEVKLNALRNLLSEAHRTQRGKNTKHRKSKVDRLHGEILRTSEHG